MKENGIPPLREPSEAALRDDLIARLRTGAISPEDAEREAVERGLGPIEVAPNPAAHDPMRKPAWSFPMALAWIMTRNSEFTRDHDNDYRELCLWFRPDGQGCITAQPGPMNVLLLGIEMNLEGRGEEFNASKYELWAALGEGRLTAYAEKEIPAFHWAKLQVYVDHAHRDYFSRDPLGVDYRSVILPRAEIIALWPPRIEAAAPTSENGPVSEDTRPSDIVTDRTGRQGRPSSRELIEIECKRRIAEGEALPGVGAESRAIAEWHKREHVPKGLRPVSAGTVENHIRAIHEEWRGTVVPTKTATK